MIATNRTDAAPVAGKPLPLALLVLIPIVLFAFGVAGVARQVRERDHAAIKHGQATVDSIHRCLENNGPEHIFRSSSWRTPDKHFFTCRLPDGTWGLSIAEETSQGWIEKTAFKVKQGTLEQLVEYVTARAELVSGVLP